MSKPDWKDAPTWAGFLAMDIDQCWYWYEHEPLLRNGDWRKCLGRSRVADLPINEDFANTLEKRP